MCAETRTSEKGASAREVALQKAGKMHLSMAKFYLGDPVLVSSHIGAVERKRLARGIPRSSGVDDEPTADAGQLLREGEAAEVPVLLHLVEQRNLRGL